MISIETKWGKCFNSSINVNFGNVCIVLFFCVRHYMKVSKINKGNCTLSITTMIKYDFILSASEASHSLWCSMINRAIYIYGRCSTVRTFLIRMPMYILAFEYFAIQVLRKVRI